MLFAADKLSQTLSLVPHPSSPSPCQKGKVTVNIATMAGSGLRLVYTLEMPQLVMPPPRQSRRQDGLWQYTCCELFIASNTRTAYREFNFSPNGAWAAYDFSDYRQHMQAVDAHSPDPEMICRCEKQRLQLTVVLDRSLLPASDETWRTGLAVIAETTHATTNTANNKHTYWALQHASQKPDFHQARTWTLSWENPL